MGCLFALFAGVFPRLMALIIWIARPVYFNAAFGGSWFWPLLGVIFLPFTTLIYIMFWSPGGLVGIDWLWLIMAVIMDICSNVGIGVFNRDRIPGTR